MKWNGDQITEELKRFLEPRVKAAGEALRDFIKEKLSENVGSVVPFVASTPPEYPYLWDGVLRDSITYLPGDHPLRAIVYSDAVDQHLHIGHHFSADEEYGHWWDGWAWDFQTGKVVKVAPAHPVEPRPFMRMGLRDFTPKIMEILTGQSESVAV